MNTCIVQDGFVERQAKDAACKLVKQIIYIKNQKDLDHETIALNNSELKYMIQSVERWVDHMIIKDGAA